MYEFTNIKRMYNIKVKSSAILIYLNVNRLSKPKFHKILTNITSVLMQAT